MAHFSFRNLIITLFIVLAFLAGLSSCKDNEVPKPLPLEDIQFVPPPWIWGNWQDDWFFFRNNWYFDSTNAIFIYTGWFEQTTTNFQENIYLANRLGELKSFQQMETDTSYQFDYEVGSGLYIYLFTTYGHGSLTHYHISNNDTSRSVFTKR